MRKLKQFWAWMFRSPDIPRSDWAVVAWWELRRIPYNLIIGSIGFVSLLVFRTSIIASGVLAPGEDSVEPIAIILAPFLLNVCYSAGWIVEIALRWNSPDQIGSFGPTLLKMGLGASLVVVTTPAIYWSAYQLLQLCGVIH